MSGPDHATPQPDWAALEWITHRQPGLMDADAAGHVWIPREITSTPTGNTTFVNYRLIAPGQPWRRSLYMPEMQDNEPAPTEPDRIAALEQRVAELEARIARVPEAIATAFDLMRAQP